MRIDPSQVAPQADVFPSPAGQGAASLDSSETKAPSPSPPPDTTRNNQLQRKMASTAQQICRIRDETRQNTKLQDCVTTDANELLYNK
jgi:hypothetical protein